MLTYNSNTSLTDQITEEKNQKSKRNIKLITNLPLLFNHNQFHQLTQTFFLYFLLQLKKPSQHQKKVRDYKVLKTCVNPLIYTRFV